MDMTDQCTQPTET